MSNVTTVDFVAARKKREYERIAADVDAECRVKADEVRQKRIIERLKRKKAKKPEIV